MVKFRWYYDADKEKAWLDEMAQKGWAMYHYFLGFYWFEACKPGEYIYQIDLFVENKGNMTYQEYLNLIEETGAEYLCRWFWWRVFRRRAELGDFKLYTDVNSKIEKYQKHLRFFRNIGIAQACVFTYDLLYTIVFWERMGDMNVFFFWACILLLVCMAVIWRNYYRIRGKIRDLKKELL